MDNIQCIYCETFITKQNLSRHHKSEQCIRIQKLIQKKENLFSIELNKQKENLKLSNRQNEKLKEENLLLNNKILTLEIKLKDALDKSEEYRKIVEKSATKTTIKNNYNHNNYLNYISSEPIRFDKLKSQLKQFVNCDTVMYDDNEFHEHIVDNILKDKSGKDKVLCTDINRKNFTYKDEKSGELISDPELEKLRDQLKKGTNIKQIRHELLEKLVTEYEENGCIGNDPYKQFSEIIQKLNFGTPFVDHVAKKTYVKSKNYTGENVKDIFTNDNFDELEYNEEEYQKLLEEFGEEI